MSKERIDGLAECLVVMIEALRATPGDFLRPPATEPVPDLPGCAVPAPSSAMFLCLPRSLRQVPLVTCEAAPESAIHWAAWPVPFVSEAFYMIVKPGYKLLTR